MFDRQTQRSRGFGFVTFQRIESIDAVFEASDHHELKGKVVEVKRAESKEATAARNAAAAAAAATAAASAAHAAAVAAAAAVPPLVPGSGPSFAALATATPANVAVGVPVPAVVPAPPSASLVVEGVAPSGHVMVRTANGLVVPVPVAPPQLAPQLLAGQLSHLPHGLQPALNGPALVSKAAAAAGGGKDDEELSLAQQLARGIKLGMEEPAKKTAVHDSDKGDVTGDLASDGDSDGGSEGAKAADAATAAEAFAKAEEAASMAPGVVGAGWVTPQAHPVAGEPLDGGGPRHEPFGCISLQESLPVPGGGGVNAFGGFTSGSQGFGMHYASNGQGFLFVPAVAPGGAQSVYAVPLNLPGGAPMAPHFSHAPMPGTYVPNGFPPQALEHAGDHFDYNRAW